MAELRQSTSQIVRFGPFLDSTDGITPEVALSIAQADMQLSKDGAAFAQKNTAGNATHDVDGFYFTTFDVTDSNTTAILEFQVNVTGALPFFKTFEVITQTYYDAKYSGTFNNVAATDIVSAGAITTLSGAVVNVDLVDTTTTNTDMVGTDGANTIAPDNTGITANGVAIAALNDISVAQVFAGGDIDGFTLEESQKLILSSQTGKASGMATTTAVIRAADDSTDRITATVDADGNRSAVTLDASG